MKNTWFSFSILFLLIAHANAKTFECTSTLQISDSNKIYVDHRDIALRKISPQFFGFNLEVIEFQDSLWDKSNKRVNNEALSLLSRFPGAVYRYPGGTVSNHFTWQQAIGPIDQRIAQKTVDYQSAKVISFGLIEYLKFVQQVNGTPWYVLNMYGSIKNSDTPINLAGAAADLAKFLSKPENNDLPTIYRWELGNELDRGRYQWMPDKYSTTAAVMTDAVRSVRTDAEFVVMGQDWAHTGAGRSGTDYNAYTAAALAHTSNEHSFHLYYDGAPWGPPLSRVFKQFCKNLEATQLPNRHSTTWVTEFGKTPIGTPADTFWKNNWPQTGDLSAAVSAADLMITLAPLESVNGAFVHSLHATKGPWPIFHKRADGVVYPGAVYWALVILRETMLEDVLSADMSVSNRSDSSVGYDTHSVVMASQNRRNFSIWTVQRGHTAENISVVIPQLAGQTVLIKTASISGKDSSENNYVVPYKVFPKRSKSIIQIGASGDFTYAVSAHSVTALSLEITSNQSSDLK
ncbi:hypothetical protein [Rhodoferax sp.]|uniref:hypothetical protein n=1 Tax=Rhodoferax sp. TaxID=50421 RepID=UPI00263871EB|nr:hypothetical protein [Rhodoferax sp.]MDD5479772.1 hypothetical protein [Rhodoferax sp.]